MGGPEGRRGSRSSSDPDPTPEEPPEPSELQRQIQFLEEQTALLRHRLQDSPRQVRVLEERLLETKGQLARALSQNERLVATLREAREQIIALKEEVQRLTSPPLELGVLPRSDPSGGEGVLSWVSGSGFGSFGTYLYSLRQDAHTRLSHTPAQRPSPSPASSKGSGSFSRFLHSLRDLDDAP
jgi:hypothetical protein